MEYPDLQELTQALAVGFESLLLQVGKQRQIEKSLKDQLAFAKHEVWTVP